MIDTHVITTPKQELFQNLPSEIIYEILSYLDMPSLCALSDTNSFWRESVPETEFRRKLGEVCPWFEPETSRFDTFRECTMEYLQRMNGKKFAPHLNLPFSATNPMEDPRPPIVDPGISTELIDTYVESLLQRASQKTSKDIYTSKFGFLLT